MRSRMMTSKSSDPARFRPGRPVIFPDHAVAVLGREREHGAGGDPVVLDIEQIEFGHDPPARTVLASSGATRRGRVRSTDKPCHVRRSLASQHDISGETGNRLDVAVREEFKRHHGEAVRPRRHVARHARAMGAGGEQVRRRGDALRTIRAGRWPARPARAAQGQQATHEVMTRWLAAMNMPSRAEFADLSARIARIEEAVQRIEAGGRAARRRRAPRPTARVRAGPAPRRPPPHRKRPSHSLRARRTAGKRTRRVRAGDVAQHQGAGVFPVGPAGGRIDPQGRADQPRHDAALSLSSARRRSVPGAAAAGDGDDQPRLYLRPRAGAEPGRISARRRVRRVHARLAGAARGREPADAGRLCARFHPERRRARAGRKPARANCR